MTPEEIIEPPSDATMTDRMLSPKGRAREIRDKWLHPSTCWIVDLVNDIEEQIQEALAVQREAYIQRAIAEEREACHVESRPDGYWLVLKNKSGEAAINLDGPSRGPIVRTVLMAAALNTGKEAGGMITECPICDWELGIDDRDHIGRCLDKKIAVAIAEMRERLAGWWDDTEVRSAEAHAVYQVEAHRRGDVRHPDVYTDLSEKTKEWDRVLVRWVAAAIRAQP